LEEVKMMNGHDYRHDRSDRDDYDEPHYRSWGEAHEEPRYHGYGRSYYDLSHRGCGHGGYYDEPYSDYDYGHYEYGESSREPYYWRGAEGGYREPRRGMYAGRGPRGYRRSDERIHEDVNERLTDDRYVDASDIEVSVDNGVVTLAGRVGSRAEKRRAEDVAELVSGVTDVSNQLRVGSSVPFTTEAPEMARVKTAR
jgi:hypothetical protein